MKNFQESMTKVINRLMDPHKGFYLALGVCNTRSCMIKFFPLNFTLIKIDKFMEIIRMYYTIIGLYCEYQNQCLVQRTVSGYGIFFLQTLPPKVYVLSSHCM